MAQQLLNLKVMRLSRPSFSSFDIVLPPNGAETRPGTFNDASPGVLSFPSAFGNIHLGETFSSYICLTNEFPTDVSDVVLRAELQTNSMKIVLTDTAPPNPEASQSSIGPTLNTLRRTRADTSQSLGDEPLNLAPTESCDCSLSHEIKELGSHILVCSVQYTLSAERRSFKRFFKFQVLNPVSVRTKVNTLSDGTVFMEAQVQNNTGVEMCPEGFEFHPQEFRAREVRSPGRKGAFLECLAVQQVEQSLFILRPPNNAGVSAANPQLGKMDIVWRTATGGRGRLQTSSLSRKPVTIELISVSIVDVNPGTTVPVDTLLTVRLQIRNSHDTDVLQPTIGLPRTRAGLVPVGKTKLLCGAMQPGETVYFDVRFHALQRGLQRFGGMIVTDVVSGASGDVDPGVEVLVW